MEGTKKCPHCGGEILVGAKKCKHCKQWLNDSPDVNLKNNNTSSWWKDPQAIIWIVVVIVFTVIVRLILDKII